MAIVHENIKAIFKEVEKFLTETIKNEKLSSSTKKHKDEILEKLSTLRKDYPAWSWSGAGPNISGGGDESSVTGGSNTDDEITSAGSHIVDLAADNAESVTKAGSLDKFKKAKLLGKWKTAPQYCVIRKDILYMYDKEKQKKQNDAFRLTDYELREGSELVKDNKKDLAFELTCPGKPTHTFLARSEEDYRNWKMAIENGIAGLNDAIEDQDIYDAVDTFDTSKDLPPPPPELYDDAIIVPKEGQLPEETYDDASSFQPPPEETYDDAASIQPLLEPDDIYDDVLEPPMKERPPALIPTAPISQKKDDLPPPVPNRDTPKSLPPLPPPPVVEEEITTDEQKPDLPPALPPSRKRPAAVPQRPPPAIPPPHVPDLPLPPIPSVDTIPIPEQPDVRKSPLLNRPLPVPVPSVPESPPSRKVSRAEEPPAIPPEEDYENMFYGKWPCNADAENELSFKYGDIIRIINREFDMDNWWIGELNGSVGLVPKTYLTPAYELLVES